MRLRRVEVLDACFDATELEPPRFKGGRSRLTNALATAPVTGTSLSGGELQARTRRFGTRGEDGVKTNELRFSASTIAHEAGPTFSQNVRIAHQGNLYAHTIRRYRTLKRRGPPWSVQFLFADTAQDAYRRISEESYCLVPL